MAFAEITNKAAADLRNRLFPAHEVFSLDDLDRAARQVAFFYRKGDRFEEQPKVVVGGLPRGTRPMATLDYVLPRQRIRFYACHWTARFDDRSEHHRSDLARHLNGEIYRYLRKETAGQEVRHVVVLGDLNEEPYGKVLEQRFYASRDRARSQGRPHYTDADMERVHLYNCAWRFMGEQRPHSGETPQDDAAGTHYWEREKTWHTLDHVIVSGGLLTNDVPYLDEASLGVVAGPTVWGPDGKPLKFEWGNGAAVGMSDHLPIYGRIVLSREETSVNI